MTKWMKFALTKVLYGLIVLLFPRPLKNVSEKYMHTFLQKSQILIEDLQQKNSNSMSRASYFRIPLSRVSIFLQYC